MRIALLVAALVLTASSVQAAPVTGAARDALAGAWRGAACGAADGDVVAPSFTLEFAMTGGRIFIDDNTEMAEAQPVKSIDETSGVLTIKTAKTEWWLKRGAGGTLTTVKAPEFFSGMAGQTFHRCGKPADRSGIHLTPAQARGISSGIAGGPTLIDSRAPKGCKAVEYQYLDFDVVGPTGFVLHRWNSSAVGEKLADGGKLNFKTDEITDFIIEQADVVPGGYKFKLTELIPPNGSRGDTTTITVNIKGKTATIPEWKRSYALCTSPIP